MSHFIPDLIDNELHKFGAVLRAILSRSEYFSTQDLEKRQVLEQALPEKFVETFEINKGFFALYCVGMSNDLVKCKDEKEIYTVDVGPIEVRDALLELETDLPSEIIVTPPGDLAYYVKTYLN